MDERARYKCQPHSGHVRQGQGRNAIQQGRQSWGSDKPSVEDRAQGGTATIRQVRVRKPDRCVLARGILSGLARGIPPGRVTRQSTVTLVTKAEALKRNNALLHARVLAPVVHRNPFDLHPGTTWQLSNTYREAKLSWLRTAPPSSKFEQPPREYVGGQNRSTREYNYTGAYHIAYHNTTILKPVVQLMAIYVLKS